MKQFAGVALVAAVLGLAPTALIAQQNHPAPPPVTEQNSVEAATITPDMLTKTVHETWVDSGRDQQKFFQVVEGMAQMSAQKRGVSLPDTEAAGRQLGMLIRQSARRDPDQLLYAVVDAAVRQIAGPGPHMKPVTRPAKPM